MSPRRRLPGGCSRRNSSPFFEVVKGAPGLSPGASAIMAPHARHRPRRLERFRQDDTADQTDPVPGGAGAEGIDPEARPSRLRRRPARQGFAQPSDRGRDRGDDRLGRALCARARAARRGGAHATRPAGADVPGRSGRGRGLQGGVDPEARGASRGGGQAAAASRRRLHRRRRRRRAAAAGRAAGGLARRHRGHRRHRHRGIGADRRNPDVAGRRADGAALRRLLCIRRRVAARLPRWSG